MSFHNSPIYPSVIAKDQFDFTERLMKISFSHNIHIDVMDGEFVPTVSFPRDGDFNFSHLKNFKDVEVHLMAVDPYHWIDYLHDAASVFIVHAELPNVNEIIAYIKSKGREAGLAISPQTDINRCQDLLKQVTHVTVMTVTPGKYGADFIPQMLEKVSVLRTTYPTYIIECDGAMSEETISLAQNAGANRFVVGSALQNNKKPERKFQHLNELLHIE